MQKIKGTTIYLTRGDTLQVTISINDASGKSYTPAQNDVIRFAMKKNYDDENLLIQKIIPHDTLLLKLDPQDTKSLTVGKYVYDIEITFENGDVDTFIDRATLQLTEEVDGIIPEPPVPDIEG